MVNNSIPNRNVSVVTDMDKMFKNSIFNQDISCWNVSNETEYDDFATGGNLDSDNWPEFK